MKLTKEERFIAYIIMLAEYKKQEGQLRSWFCDLIWDLFWIDDYGPRNNRYSGSTGLVMRNFFPELNKLMETYKPSRKDYKTRENILKQCIKETAP
jgi:hypothetical protein